MEERRLTRRDRTFSKRREKYGMERRKSRHVGKEEGKKIRSE